MSEPRAYYVAEGDGVYRPTTFAQGAWDDGETHFSPLGGLLVHAIERHRASTTKATAPLALARVSFDILGFLALEPCTVRVETRRPGRTIELVEATAAIGGRDVAVARAWHTVLADTAEVEGGADPAMPSTQAGVPWDGGGWSGGFVHSVDVRVARDGGPGSRAVWVASPLALVDGEDVAPIAAWIGLVDVANGIAARVPPGTWVFPNVDLTIHLHRQPEGAWVGLDTSVAFGHAGQGVTSTRLHDARGHVGTASQALTIRRLAP